MLFRKEENSVTPTGFLEQRQGAHFTGARASAQTDLRQRALGTRPL